MPSAEETSYLIEVMPDSGQDDFTTHDVDVLVSRIKENLRLSGLSSKRLSDLKSKRLSRREMRSSPYKLPYSDWTPEYKTDGSLFSSGDDEQEQQHRQSQLRRNYRKKWRVAESEADSYERFKALLRNNLLIKEAVKRLKTYEEDEDKDDTWEEEESGSTRRASTTSATSTTLDGLDGLEGLEGLDSMDD